MTLSVCIIAHNEAKKLPRTLESIRFANEVIVADCESSDSTREIAAAWGARVFQRPNLENLNINKNFTFDQASSDFILCLDADEVIPEVTSREIRDVISADTPLNGYYLPRRNHWMGQWLKHGGQYPDWQLRLFRRGSGRFPEKHVHERLDIEGAIGRLKNPLHHHPYESLEDCRLKLDFYTDFEAKFLYSSGVRPSFFSAVKYLILQPAQRYLRRYIFKGGFLDGRAGWEAVRMDMRNFRERYSKLQAISKQVSP
ncbi:MAG: glycosyltransferase family 2 protein [bacterium]|nr:glycosyltransferase family 2 protein [bacterium]